MYEACNLSLLEKWLLAVGPQGEDLTVAVGGETSIETILWRRRQA